MGRIKDRSSLSCVVVRWKWPLLICHYKPVCLWIIFHIFWNVTGEKNLVYKTITQAAVTPVTRCLGRRHRVKDCQERTVLRQLWAEREVWTRLLMCRIINQNDTFDVCTTTGCSVVTFTQSVARCTIFKASAEPNCGLTGMSPENPEIN